MSDRRHRVAATCAGVFLGTVPFGPLGMALGQTAATAPAERVVITGSNIRRTDVETPSPVLSLSAQDIARSGYTSVADVLSHITANNMGSLGQATPGAFGAGGSGVSLRGLTVGATLVLIDGYRMASYPLPDDGQRDFVDIASIPIEAVERIEVLKDGASAIYGSDAMAGVINVILKKSHQGTTLQAQTGLSSRRDGRMVKVSGIRGFGDANQDPVSGYVAVSARQQKPILLNQRPGLAGSDWTPYGGEDLGLTPNPDLQVSPKTSNFSLMGKMLRKLSPDWTLDISASLLGSSATQVGLLNTVSPDSGITSFVFGPKHPSPVPSLLNGTNVIDPRTGEPVSTTFEDIPAQRTQTSSTSYRLVAQLNGTWGAWDVQAATGWTRVRTRLDMHHFISLPALQSALNAGTYTLGVPASASTLAALAPVAQSTSHNDLHFVSVRGSRELMTLPGGPLSVGAGVEFMHRSLLEQFPETFATGIQSSNIYAFGVGQQNIGAAYVEVSAPLTKALQVDAAARVDHYNTYGSSATPKVGVKYAASKQVLLRGTFSQGFRAPNPVEAGISGSSAGFLPPLVDTALCKLATPGEPCTIPVGGTELQLPGQKLKPEKSKSLTLGVVLEPTPQLNVSLDYYDIRISNQIVSVGLFGHSQIDFPAAYGTKLYRVNSPTTANAAPSDANDTILYGTYPFINLGQTRTNGFDVDLRMRLDGGEMGRFTPQLQWSRMLHYTINREGTVYELAGTHGPSFVSTNTGTPKDRAALSLTWAKGPWEVTGTWNHISSFDVTDASYAMPDCASALSLIFPNGLPRTGSPLCKVGAFSTLNLSGRYQVSRRLAIQGSISNVLDRKAPIDAFASSSAGGGVGSGGAHYDPALHQDGAVGRYLNVGLSYSF